MKSSKGQCGWCASGPKHSTSEKKKPLRNLFAHSPVLLMTYLYSWP